MWHFTNLPDFRRQMFENEAIWIVRDLSLFMTWKKANNATSIALTKSVLGILFMNILKSETCNLAIALISFHYVPNTEKLSHSNSYDMVSETSCWSRQGATRNKQNTWLVLVQ